MRALRRSKENASRESDLHFRRVLSVLSLLSLSARSNDDLLLYCWLVSCVVHPLALALVLLRLLSPAHSSATHCSCSHQPCRIPPSLAACVPPACCL